MSNPANPLAIFRTYAYHFVLAVAEDTAAARNFIESNPFDSLPRTGRTTERVVNGQVAPLINSKQDIDYVIDEFTMSNILVPQGGKAGGTGVGTHAMFNVESKMVITEPRGVDFLNDLREIHRQMGRDPAGTTFILFIQWVGHTDDDPAQEQIVESMGIMLKLAFIEASFTEEGGKYDLTFIGVGNGITRTPQVVKALDRATVKNATDRTLGAAFRTLQDKTNKTYNDEYEKERTKLGRKPGGRVQYAFDAGELKACTIDQKLALTTSEGNPKQERGSFNFGENVAIDTALYDMSQFCSEILNYRENDVDKRFVVNVVSTEVSGGDARRLAPQYGVREDVDYLYVYKLVLHKQALTTNDIREQARRNDVQVAQDGNSIEFNYFFTGLNTDILAFDLNMNMALAYIATYNDSPNLGETATATDNNPTDSSKVDSMGTSQDPETIENTPWLPGQTVKTIKVRNKKSPQSAKQNRAAMAKAAGLEMLEANMTITGNPSLLANLNPDPINQMLTETPRLASTPGSDVLKDWQKLKGFVKVNIQSQVNGEDGGNDAEFRKRDFWYDGFYEILAVDSTFKGGSFTQDLMMMSLPFAFPNQSNDANEPSSRTLGSNRSNDQSSQEYTIGDPHEEQPLPEGPR